jgi:hypothetical protein
LHLYGLSFFSNGIVKYIIGGSVSDPDSINPDSESASGSGSRRAKMTQKFRNFMFSCISYWIFSFEGCRLLL